MLADKINANRYQIRTSVKLCAELVDRGHNQVEKKNKTFALPFTLLIMLTIEKIKTFLRRPLKNVPLLSTLDCCLSKVIIYLTLLIKLIMIGRIIV